MKIAAPQFCLLFSLLALASCAGLDPELVTKAEEKWGKTIAELEAKDRAEKDPENAILFLGSSSIRLWDSIAEDMAPYPAIQRGYGGAKFSDGAVFAERLITPHRYRAVVMFFGNDVSGKETDATPEEVAGWFKRMAGVATRHQPDAQIFCIAVTPTSSRWDAWPQVQEVNRALAEACNRDPRLHFIPTATAFLGENGKPMDRLFRDDRLHLNPSGYDVWAGIIKGHLSAVLGGAG